VKYLLLFALLAAVLFLLYWRLRPYIRGLRRFIGVVREIRRVRGGERPADLPRRPGRAAAANEKLLRCAACGTWMPTSRAVTLRGGATYCSHTCLERSADPRHTAHKSAS